MNVIIADPAKLKWSEAFQPEIAQFRADKGAINVEHVADSLLAKLLEIDLGRFISYIPKIMKVVGPSVAHDAGDRDTAVRIAGEVVDRAEIGEDGDEKVFIKGLVSEIAEKILQANAKQFQINQDGVARDQNPDLSGDHLGAWTTEQAKTLAPLFIAGEGQAAQVTPGAIANAVQRAMELVERVGTFADNPERKAAAVEIILKAAHAAAGLAGLPEDKIDRIVTPVANAAIEIFIKASKGQYEWLNGAIKNGADKLDVALDDIEEEVPLDGGHKPGKGKDAESGSGSESKKKCCNLL